MDIEDKRPEYLSAEGRINQAKRLIPILEAEIAAGETRQIFFDLLEMHKKYLDDAWVASWRDELPDHHWPDYWCSHEPQCRGTKKRV